MKRFTGWCSRLFVLLTVTTASSMGVGLANADDAKGVDKSDKQAPKSCESLASLALPNTTITVAKAYPAGVNPVPAPPGTFGALSGVLPVSICRIAGSIKPTPVSNIQFEVWMPAGGWNGKFNGVGGAGLSGFINYNDMDASLRRGYATASTDTGHQAFLLDGSWMLDNPELVVDFALRSHHLTAQAGKAIVKAYYGKGPEHAYFTGCSNGGEQGLSEAQRFPDDYDGVVAGAPASYPTHMWPGEVYPAWLTQSGPKGLISKLPALSSAAYAACDATDGLQDGVIDDPRKCHFNPATIQCPAGVDSASCLTATQVDWVKKIYAGLEDPTTGKLFWPGYEVGSELQWDGHIDPGLLNPPLSYFKFLVYKKPSWYYTDPAFDLNGAATFNDLYTADAKFRPVLDAIDPDLRPFAKRGGKLILWHGWADQNIAPRNTISYYDNVVATVGGSRADHAARHRTQKFARLFMAPGMLHCGGGPGPNSFDALTALEQWVEHGQAPERIVASHLTNGVVDRTRPLCPYPEVAVYRGSGSIDDAANFHCRAPEERE